MISLLRHVLSCEKSEEDSNGGVRPSKKALFVTGAEGVIVDVVAFAAWPVEAIVLLHPRPSRKAPVRKI